MWEYVQWYSPCIALIVSDRKKLTINKIIIQNFNINSHCVAFIVSDGTKLIDSFVFFLKIYISYKMSTSTKNDNAYVFLIF